MFGKAFCSVCEPLAFDDADVGIRNAGVFDADDVCFRDSVHAEVIIVIVVGMNKDGIAGLNVSLDDVRIGPDGLDTDTRGEQENRGKK